MSRRLHWLALGLLLMAGGVGAAVDTFEFSSEQERDRFYAIGSELRCPKCQNQNIADSDAPIAADLRQEVFRLLEDGRSDDEIVDYMVARYGEFVRYKPALNRDTAVLWFGPLAFLLVGVLALVLLVRRRQRAVNESSDAGLSPQEQKRLDELLNKKSQDD
ncbi:cytochrome c-type biogenesis protein CcmH [Halopseudomonas aestusnigri]|jgi:cytochrome c-type biogenesis protein CcmH|uniref:cytochrome c-type biogenesis protein n=1 Tax=Halopseudomonas TaxID=2901189 RepID=UPI0022B6B01B|nr:MULTISPECIES: cytochrome c-type biogenesis protein [Halopseudomonas]MDL2197657.1 cytochrome c-type biogenesis protein CcmH [Halopseudomonas aestusnigri]BDX19408.1 cytochrome c-type biogenesis protein CcmH [Halopseudomonas aestusnigri]GMQ52989.1 cytochrome c maturation protein CcmH [Halopseudomonas aestusnigri]|tara:strand:- start:249 stop:731 length:483 start_codon:yes stop_codon:yes gene_type:complete